MKQAIVKEGKVNSDTPPSTGRSAAIDREDNPRSLFILRQS